MKKFALIILIGFMYRLSAQEGLVAEYYNGTDFEEKVMTRIDPKIDFYWGGGVQPASGMNRSHYSIRWVGKLLAPETGKYLFSAKADDGIRLWVNNVPLINAWVWQDRGNFSNSIELEANKIYDIKVEYFNSIIEGEITILWQLPSQVNSPNYSYSNFKSISEKYYYQPQTDPKQFLPPVVASKNTKPSQSQPQTIKKNTPSVSKPKTEIKPATTFEKLDKDLDIKQVFFIRSVNKMTDNSVERLDKVVKFLKNKPSAKIELKGHTDVMGDAEKNRELSVSRAKVVSDYLISKGISENRITFQGFGGTQPLIAEPKTEEERAVNRRVEFVIK